MQCLKRVAPKMLGSTVAFVFLNKFDVKSIGACFGGNCRDDTFIAVAFCPNTKALQSGDSCTWIETLLALEKGFLVCLMFRLHVGLGQ